ncbi:family 43 glycosylhydrolase [Paenibacillus planticolens]|nr:family 43 glycosylhydrolase [Paenibacillus planticolens]
MFVGFPTVDKAAEGATAAPITSIRPVFVSTIAGTAPVLPKAVTAVHSDATTSQEAVVWAGINPSNYAAAGKFQVEGTVEGTTAKAAATVTVLQDASKNMKVWYKFEEGTGTKVADSSGNGNDGIMNANATDANRWTSANKMQGSYAANFNGGAGSSTTANYVKMPNGILQGVNEMTFAVWVRNTNTAAWQRVFDLGNDNTHYMFYTLNSGSDSRLGIKLNTGAEQTVSGPQYNTNNVWRHIVVTYKNSTASVYVNGVKVGSGSVTTKPSDLETLMGGTIGNFLGKSQFSADSYFYGQMDDFRMYTSALDDNTISNLYAETSTDDAGAVALAKNALTIADASNIVSDITLQNFLYGANISWVSNNPAYVSDAGVVTRPAKGEPTANVTLTATITKNGVTDTKEINVSVLPVGVSINNIEIDVNGKGVDINPTTWGVFFEDINYALDGGLYAELVQNRSFEMVKVSGSRSSSSTATATTTPAYTYAWNPVQKGGGVGTMTTSTEKALHVNNPNFLRLSVTNAGDGVGVYNTGYSSTTGTQVPSMTLVQGDKYNFSLYVRSSDYKGPVEVSLTSDDGSTVYASSQLTGITSDWQKLSGVLEPGLSTNTGRLQVLVKGTGTVDLDMVSLMPQKTWMNRPNGARYDLAKQIADLHPKYFRFPGGCAVQGISTTDSYRWKESVGPVEERKNNMNFWFDSTRSYYNQSLGFGFYEFFQFAEDIGAAPIPAINVGMSWGTKTIVPVDQMGPFIQDAVDLADFANSTDMNNKWAKLRADMGHPAPFNLRYMEIGNEDSGTNYYTRYAMVADALRKSHPEIKLIIGGGITMGDNYNLTTWQNLQQKTVFSGLKTDADLVDEHYYTSNANLYANVTRYDNYDRSAQKVFIGEYASNSTSSYLQDALAEAAYMTHIEENGDIVELASYAPLLAKQNYTQWTPDLMYFNNQMVYGTANYYVQKMFFRNTGNVTLPTEIIKAGQQSYKIKGAIGLGGNSTAAQFKNVIVQDNTTQKELFRDDFSGSNSKWTATAGTWSMSDGTYAQTSTTINNALSYAGSTNMSDYTVTFQAKKTAGSSGITLYAGVQDANNYYRWNIGSSTRGAFEKSVNGTVTALTTLPDYAKLPSLTTGQWYNFKMVVSGNRIKCYADDKLIFDIVDRPWKKSSSVYTVTSKDTSTGDIYVKVVNPQSTPQMLTVNLNGADYINPVGLKTVLTGAATAVNSYANPYNVYPVTTKMTNLSASNEMTFDPYSLTVLKFRTAAGNEPDLQTVTVAANKAYAKAGDTVRLNITDSQLSDKRSADLSTAAITYGTDHPEIITFDLDGKAAIGQSGKAKAVKLWANVSLNGVTVKSNEEIVSLDSDPTDVGLYVMAYSKTLGTTGSNNNYMSFYDDSLHLAYSADGVKWTALNDNKGMLFYKVATTSTSTTAYNNAAAKQFRDPFIFQKGDGTYVLLATTVRNTGAVSDVTINYWDSTDLLNWNNQKLITVSSGSVFPLKPQLKYNAANDNYVIMWSDASNKNYYNTIDKTFTTVSTAAPYSGTDYPAAVPTGVSVSNPPDGALVGSVVTVSQRTLDNVISQLGTPTIPLGTDQDGITITTSAGQAPVLPSTTHVQYSDGTSIQKSINWDTIDANSYSKEGTFTATGLVEGAPNYMNPINKNGADPDIFKGPDGYYYYTSSYMDYSHNGSKDYQYDRVAIRRAATIEGLSTAAERTVFLRKPSGDASYHIWAPEIHYMKFPGETEGKWVIYFAGGKVSSNFDLRVYEIECDSQDPMTGNWSDITKVTISGEIFDLDATVFQHNNEWYMAWAHKPGSNSLINIAKMTSRTTLDSQQVTIAFPEYTWERRADRVLEGPTVMKKNGKIFMGYAAGSTDSTYSIGLLTAVDSPNTDLLDPASWKKTPYPLMIGSQENQQFGPGHATFTEAEDGKTAILSYHARPNQGYSGVSGYSPLYDATRYARVAVIYWHKDGTPYFGIPPKDGYLPGAGVTATVKVTPSKSADKSALQNKMDEAQGLTQSHYTPATWAALQNALSSALTVMNNANATQAEVDAEAANLQTAISGLQLVKKDLKVSISVPDNVYAGQDFDLTYGLTNVNDSIYAQDLTFMYDPEKVTYISSEALSKGVNIVSEKGIQEKGIRLLVASLGDDNAVKGDGGLIKLHFKAKPVIATTETVISLSNAVVSNGHGVETQLEDTSQRVHITYVDTRIPGDVDGSGKVSIGDLAIVAKYYGKTSADEDWALAKSADVNHDGVIDISDLAIVARLILQIQ